MKTSLDKLAKSALYFCSVILIAVYAVGITLTSLSCRSDNSDTVTPQPATPATGDFFSKCIINGYSCYGDGSTNFTLLYPNQNGGDYYQFSLGMIVNNNGYQQLTTIISLSSFSGKGTYILTSSNAEVHYVVRPAVDSYQSAKVTGTLEITDYQSKKYIQGKFTISSSSGARGLDLKDGTFKVEASF